MKVLITGASSGIGLEIAKIFINKGYELVLVARNLNKLRREFNDIDNISYMEVDLSIYDNIIRVYEENKDIDILVNNAGFGECGYFYKTNMDKELNMIDVNVRAYHMLTKLYLKEFKKKDKGRILNVGSMAGFMPGAYMSTYYATKAYVNVLTLSVYEELKRENSNIHISLFAPGPVNTLFNKRANVKFNAPSLSSKKAAEIAVRGMFKNKALIIPGNMRMFYILSRIAPIMLVAYINSYIQERKQKN